MENEKNFGITTGGIIKLGILLLSLVLVLYLILTVALPAVSEIRSTDVGKGVINLREQNGFDYEKDLFALNSEWEFYPNRLLYPADFAEGTPEGMVYRQFPHYWRDEQTMPEGTGFATYRMKITMPAEAVSAGVFSNFQYGAYDIYLNGYRVCGGGNVSENKDEHYFTFNGSAGYVNLTSGSDVEVIVHVQCYEHVRAGFSQNVIIGSSDSIANYRAFITVVTGMIVGALAILIFYFLLLFTRNRDKCEYLNFAIVSLCGLYLALTYLGDCYAYFLVPTVSYKIIYSIEYFALLLGGYFASMHIIRKYIKYKHTGKIGAAFAGANCLLVVFLTPFQISVFLPYFSIVSIGFVVVAFILSLINTIRGRLRKDGQEYPIIESVSLLVLISGVLIAELGGFMLWSGFDMFPVSVVVYCFMQIFVLSGYYKSVEKDLLKLTKALEQRVAERTAALMETTRRVEAADSVKSEFLTRMTREMMLPMNAIIGMSELFYTENLNETQKNHFRDIKETASSLLNFINDIMDFSRIEAAKLELAPSHFNLSTFIENICSAAKVSAKLKELEFKSVISEELPEVVYGDETRMKQVIVNIISNAVKYTRKGEVKLKAEVTEGLLLFTVSDTGVGMRKENIPRMFDAFMNPDSTKNRGLKGTGLGLAICKRLMEMQKGRIEFDSEEGKGSEFRLYFPLTVGDKNLIQNTGVSEKIYAKNAKVLVVDDNSINVTVALGVLATHDIRPDVAKDGYKALRMVREKDYDLVFMDQFMPEMDGVETTQRIREMGGKYSSLPIVAMTSNVVRGIRDMLIFKGMNDYIAKPVNQNELNNILIRWLPHDKITSALGRFNKEENTELLAGLPPELIAITELNCSEALKNMNSNVEIYTGLLRQLAREADDYADNLAEYIKAGDLVNYIIVINGVKSLLYSIGAKSSAEMASQLEKAATDKNEKFCLEKNSAFCENLRWLSQRVSLALPHESGEEDEESGDELQGESAGFTEIMQKLSLAFSIGDCDTIDRYVAALKDRSFGEKYDEAVSDIFKETEIMEYEKAAELSRKILEKLSNE